MTIFAIIHQPSNDPAHLGSIIGQTYPNDLYNVGNGVWLISAASTAKDVSDRLGISDGRNGSALVIEVGSYFGRANPAIWSWISAKWGRPAHG